MKKSDLITLLQEIEGNPEVVLWNGFVGDYQHISKEVVEGHLVKSSYETFLRHVRFENMRDTGVPFNEALKDECIEQLKKDYRKYYKWEHNNYVTSESIKVGDYKSKRVVYLQPKLRGETTFDRAGDISY